jgi:nicotinamidase/pyrazinamidase
MRTIGGARRLVGVAEVGSAKLQPGDGLLLVDVQRDFCPGGALPVPEGDRVVPVLNRWVRAAQRAGVPIYVSRDWHPHRHPSFEESGGSWPPHCIQGSPGAELHPDLELPPGVLHVIKGVRFDRDQLSAFDATGLASRLARDAVHGLWVGGLALDVCVRATVLDAIDAGLEVHVIVSGTRAITEAGGREALRVMADAGATLAEQP